MEKRGDEHTEEMYLAVELWQESGLTAAVFCEREKIPRSTFRYWIEKYEKTRQDSPSGETGGEKFIPLEVSVESGSLSVSQLEICYPNGVKVSCPAEMETSRLKALISII